MRYALIALALAGCGKPQLTYEALLGTWIYEECTWGGEKRHNVPCNNFRPPGRVEFAPDSTVRYVVEGSQALYSGKITAMEFSGMAGTLTGQSPATSHVLQAEIRIQDSKLIYKVKVSVESEIGNQEIEEHAVLRKLP